MRGPVQKTVGEFFVPINNCYKWIKARKIIAAKHGELKQNDSLSMTTNKKAGPAMPLAVLFSRPKPFFVLSK